MNEIFTTNQAPHGRGCGDRDEEMPYLCCGLSKWGKPVEDFLLDPALLWPGKFQRGVKIMPRNPKDPNSVNDIIIFVGAKPDKKTTGYPFFWDFVEETRRFGASRKVSPDLPFEKLTPWESRLIFCHAKVVPRFEYKLNRESRPVYGCHQLQFWHDNPDLRNSEAPAAHLDQTVCTPALKDLAFLLAKSHLRLDDPEWYRIDMPSFFYTAKYPLSPNIPIPTGKVWRPALFMALPLTHIEFKKKPHAAAQEKAQAAGFDTTVLDY